MIYYYILKSDFFLKKMKLGNLVNNTIDTNSIINKTHKILKNLSPPCHHGDNESFVI